jgi:hypothetical protein
MRAQASHIDSNEEIPAPNQFKKESSYTVAHQLTQFSFSYVFSCLLWFVFFSPLTAKFQMENAFGLPYIGIHIVGLYIGLGVFIVTSYLTYLFFWSLRNSDKEKHFYSEHALMAAVVLAFSGSFIRLFSYLNSSENGKFWCFAAGHTLICISIAITFNIQTVV